MSFADDELIPQPRAASVDSSTSFVAGKTKATVVNNPTAPLEESKFKVLLELTGYGACKDRSGLDLVMVLDVSESMKGEKLEKMKIAVQFVIKKLCVIDRLSVVVFSEKAWRLCPLRRVTDTSKAEIEALFNGLVSGDGTNIGAGLEMGLKILEDRCLKSGRVVGIMLMSGSKQKNAFPVGPPGLPYPPIYTFGFGVDHDPTVLQAIAESSKGGTFSDVHDQSNLSLAFSQCLAGLLSVVVQDLNLTVRQLESTIKEVSAGNYPQSKDENAGSVTVSFGDLYNKEVRRVVVELLLPAVKSRVGADILEFDYSYDAGVKRFNANPIIVAITRTGISAKLPEREEVLIEESRLQAAKFMKEARVMADEKKLEDAKDKLDEAQNMLSNVTVDSHPVIDMLRTELQHLARLMKSQETYEKKGRSFALSSESCHARQRFAARGDDLEKVRLFATPRMDAYLKQAKLFDENPRKALPSVEEDVKEEHAADPLAAIVGPLSYYVQTATQALQSIHKILSTTRG